MHENPYVAFPTAHDRRDLADVEIGDHSQQYCLGLIWRQDLHHGQGALE